MRDAKSYALLLFIFFLLIPIKLFSAEIEYSFIPKKVYKKQVFPISFLSRVNYDGQIVFKFGDKTPILKEPVAIKDGTKTFYTFYFKTDEPLFKIPSVIISIGNKKIKLNSIEIPVKNLPKKDDFCGVIASGLKVKSYQASTFDEKTNLIAMVIEAHDANLEDIYVPAALKDGIENIRRTGSRIEGNYYIVLPAKQRSLTFSYFDTIKDKFIEKHIPISIDDGSVAAQTDLNPKDDSFEKLKKYTLVGLIILFLLLFLWKKDFFYLIVGVIASIVLLTFYTPLSKICIKAGSPLYIIPTYNSTISVYTDQQFTTTELYKRGKYHKITYKNGIIGWIKDEDVCKK
ncbi:MAG: hypothetical protein GXO60_09050 [Epsilonproteobacteria bacterium]|nr:hypothetical protein [Campylobacterota bacterium]